MIDPRELRRAIFEETAPLRRLTSEKRIRRLIQEEMTPLEQRLAEAEELAQTARREAAVAAMGYEMVKEGLDGINQGSNRRWIDMHNTTEKGFAKLEGLMQEQTVILAAHTQAVQRLESYEKLAKGAGRLALGLPLLRWLQALLKYLFLLALGLVVVAATALITVELLY